MQNQVNRYSQVELEEFRLLIQKKLDTAETQIVNMQAQINDINDDEDDHGTDLIDDSNNSSQLEMLTTMAGRQRKHIRDLENALLRIRNKSYGICIVMGELIDKKRLFAVLTTTKSIAGKTLEATPVKRGIPKIKPIATPQSFSRVIKKVNPNSTIETKKVENVFFDDADNEEEDFEAEDVFIDPDSLSEENIG
jgi:RNA polymerase-binding transcription factor DksA